MERASDIKIKEEENEKKLLLGKVEFQNNLLAYCPFDVHRSQKFVHCIGLIRCGPRGSLTRFRGIRREV